MILGAVCVLLAPLAADAEADGEERCAKSQNPASSATTETPIALRNPVPAEIKVDYGTGRKVRHPQTFLSPSLAEGQQLPGPRKIAVIVHPLEQGTTGELKRVHATAEREGDLVAVTLCVDSRGGPTAGSYTGAIRIVDPRFKADAIPVTIRLQARWTGWTVILVPVIAVVGVLIAALSAEAGKTGGSGWRRVRKRVWSGQGITAVLAALGATGAVWAATVYQDATFGRESFLAVGPFWTMGASAVAAAAVALGASAAATTHDAAK